MARLTACGLRVDFPLYHLTGRSLKKQLLARTNRSLRTDPQDRVVVAALQGLDFTIEAGERVALVGSNGAGKTTLLRTLAGIYEPVAGTLEIEGRVGTLIDPAAGMEPWSTGRENIRLRGLYWGLSAPELDELEARVADFTGLGEFLDVPIHGYSAGMAIRLAFGIATAVQPTILLMDEWIAAGDAQFMLKAQARLEHLVDTAEILVLATHSRDIVTRWCNRALHMEAGRIVADGTPAEVFAAIDDTPAEEAAAPPEPAASVEA